MVFGTAAFTIGFVLEVTGCGATSLDTVGVVLCWGETARSVSVDAVLITAAASEVTELVGDEAGTGATGPVVAVADVEAGEVVPDVVSAGSANAPTRRRTPTTAPPTQAIAFFPLLQLAGCEERAKGRSGSVMSTRPSHPAEARGG